MNRLFAILPFALALPIVIGSAVLQGSKSERWGQFPAMKLAASRLEKLPLTIDVWQGKIGPKLDDLTRRVAGAEGDLRIDYTNSKTKQQVSLFLDCGRLMDMQNHRPDRCFPANGYRAAGGEPSLQSLTPLAGKSAKFKSALYAKDDGAVQIFWSWSSEGIWIAPEDDDLRPHFSREQPIFKLYVSKGVTDLKSTSGEDVIADFIKVALPEINKALFPDSKPAATAAPVAGSPSPTR